MAFLSRQYFARYASLCLVACAGREARAFEVTPIAGALSLSASDFALAVGARAAVGRFEFGGVGAGVKTDAYLRQVQYLHTRFRYSVAPMLQGAAGLAVWRTQVSYTAPEVAAMGNSFTTWGPSFNLAFRPLSFVELGFDYSFGIPGNMILLNTWAPKGLLYLGVVL